MSIYINSTTASGNWYVASFNVDSSDLAKLLNCNMVSFVPCLIGDGIINVGYSSELVVDTVKTATTDVEVRGGIYWLDDYMENSWFLNITTNNTATFTLYVNSDMYTDKIHSLYKVKVIKLS